MIRPEDMRRGPATPEGGYLPPATEEALAQAIAGKIEAVTGELKSVSRLFLPRPWGHTLFRIKAAQELINIEDLRDKFVGSVDPETLQRVAFAEMSKYGFNPERSRPVWHFPHQNGTRSETLAFPSDDIPGLSFERHRKFWTETGKTIQFHWNVMDRAPKFNWFRSNPKGQPAPLGI